MNDEIKISNKLLNDINKYNEKSQYLEKIFKNYKIEDEIMIKYMNEIIEKMNNHCKVLRYKLKEYINLIISNFEKNGYRDDFIERYTKYYKSLLNGLVGFSKI